MSGRYLPAVIDAMVAIAPDLKDALRSVRSSAMYCAPEMMSTQWNRAAAILNDVAVNHPKAKELAAIFSGDAHPHDEVRR